VSKYCNGLAALRPTLPANKWHRVLSTVVWPQTSDAPLAADAEASGSGVESSRFAPVGERGVDAVDPSLRQAVSRLAAGHPELGIEKVTAIVQDSYQRLVARSTISAYLPILVERDAGTRLNELDRT
jgi:hypothetical protein